MASTTGHIVCHGALCMCKYGKLPDKLVVLTNPMHTTNDSEGKEKLTASTMDIGVPFENKTFGPCSKKPFNAACTVQVTEWQDFYDKVTLKNGGNPLLEGSKAVCPVGGDPCISITWHGQTAEASAQEVQQTDEKTHSAINPIVPPSENHEPTEPFDKLKAIMR